MGTESFVLRVLLGDVGGGARDRLRGRGVVLEVCGSKEGGVCVLIGSRPPSPHNAVASQLVPREIWRHLVSVSTVAIPEGWGRASSAPVTGEDAADARLQGVGGAGAPSLRAWLEMSVEEFLSSDELGLCFWGRVWVWVWWWGMV